MATYNEPIRPYEFVLKDQGDLSYDAVTLASGAGSLVAGSVIGRVSKRLAAAPIPGAPNTTGGTGTGAMSALSFGPDVQVGNYVITLLATSATAAFSVVAPDGTALPNGAVATAYKSSHLSFLIANGGTMTTGDSYTVAVTAGGTPVVHGGTGNGVMSAISLGKYAQRGGYRIINRVVIANGGDFEVIAPDGSVVGRFPWAASGSTASFTSEHLNFTLSDDTDYIAGNYFNVIVAGYTAPECKLWDPLAVDGTQEVYGIITHAADASSTTAAVNALTRIATVNAAALTWKTTVTAAQKAEAYRQMAANFIIARS